MKNENFKIQLIATQALHEKYGFCPATEQVKLLESDGEGTYILFRVGEHEYRCENGEITNLEEQKKLDAELSANVELLRMRQRDMDELREQQEKQEKQFVTKELMLTEAYNLKRMEIEDWKGRMRLLQTLADDRRMEIEKLEKILSELKKENKILKEAEDLLKKYRKNCSDQQVEINRLKSELNEREAEHAAVEAARKTAAYRASRLEG